MTPLDALSRFPTQQSRVQSNEGVTVQVMEASGLPDTLIVSVVQYKGGHELCDVSNPHAQALTYTFSPCYSRLDDRRGPTG
jgi:hypothetical protein